MKDHRRRHHRDDDDDNNYKDDDHSKHNANADDQDEDQDCDRQASTIPTADFIACAGKVSMLQAETC